MTTIWVATRRKTYGIFFSYYSTVHLWGGRKKTRFLCFQVFFFSILRRGRSSELLLDDLKKKRKYFNLKGEALARTVEEQDWNWLWSCSKADYAVHEQRLLAAQQNNWKDTVTITTIVLVTEAAVCNREVCPPHCNTSYFNTMRRTRSDVINPVENFPDADVPNTKPVFKHSACKGCEQEVLLGTGRKCADRGKYRSNLC